MLADTSPGFGLPDDNHNADIFAGTAVTTFIAFVIVVLRFWIRSRIVRCVGWDDYLVLVAFVSMFR
jgi:hypothetical protein